MDENLKLPNNRILDVFIVYVETNRQSIRAQKKFHRMGFYPSTCNQPHLFNKRYGCYLVAQMCHSNDEYNGNKWLSFGYKDQDHVEDSKEFDKSLMPYKKFIKM